MLFVYKNIPTICKYPRWNVVLN